YSISLLPLPHVLLSRLLYPFPLFFFFFFTQPAPPELYTLSLHDALPISPRALRGDDVRPRHSLRPRRRTPTARAPDARPGPGHRSEEHTSELQSQSNLVCRLLLEKKKKKTNKQIKTNNTNSTNTPQYPTI